MDGFRRKTARRIEARDGQSLALPKLNRVSILAENKKSFKVYTELMPNTKSKYKAIILDFYIPIILFLWNLVQAYDLANESKMRFNLMGNGDHWFPENKPVSLECLNFTKCFQYSNNSKGIPSTLKKLMPSCPVKRSNVSDVKMREKLKGSR